MPATFGERLRDLIERNEYKQKSFAEKLNVSLSTLNGYVNNYRLPNQITIVRIAELLGVTTDYLLGCESRPVDLPLSNAERELLENLRALDKEKQEVIFKLTDMLSQK